MYIQMIYDMILKTLMDFRYTIMGYYYEFYFNYLYHYRLTY